MDDSAIMCDEISEETVPINLNENKANCKMQNFYILLAFLLILILYIFIIIWYNIEGKKTFITISLHK